MTCSPGTGGLSAVLNFFCPCSWYGVYVRKHGKPAIINSDQGSQFTSDEYVNAIKGMKGILISMDGKGRALDNVWVERFFRTIKYEHIFLNPSDNGKDLERSVSYFVEYYNYHRKHSSLSYETPASVYKPEEPVTPPPTLTVNYSNRSRKDIASLRERQGQALRVADRKFSLREIFPPQTLTFTPAC